MKSFLFRLLWMSLILQLSFAAGLKGNPEIGFIALEKAPGSFLGQTRHDDIIKAALIHKPKIEAEDSYSAEISKSSGPAAEWNEKFKISRLIAVSA